MQLLRRTGSIGFLITLLFLSQTAAAKGVPSASREGVAILQAVSPTGEAQLRLVHVWRGYFQKLITVTANADSWSQNLEIGQPYIVTVSRDDAKPSTLTPLEDVPDFTIRLFMEAGTWIAMLLLLRILSSLVFRYRPFPALTVMGLIVGLLLAGHIRALMTDSSTEMHGWMLAVSPACLFFGAGLGALLSFKILPSAVQTYTRVLPFLLLVLVTVLLFVADPVDLIGFSASLIIVASAARRPGLANGASMLLLTGGCCFLIAGAALAVP